MLATSESIYEKLKFKQQQLKNFMSNAGDLR